MKIRRADRVLEVITGPGFHGHAHQFGITLRADDQDRRPQFRRTLDEANQLLFIADIHMKYQQVREIRNPMQRIRSTITDMPNLDFKPWINDAAL